MNLTDHQNAARLAIEAWLADPGGKPWFYLAGYAGTGKTTLLAELLGATSRYVLVGAYTGKAAAVLRSKGLEAHTLHSLAYAPVPGSSPVEFDLNPDSPIQDCDFLAVDEVSMIDDRMAEDLLSFRKKILVLGDPGQLPPVRGEGYFTRGEPDFFLTEIHRQAAESPILRAATAAREGRRLPLYNSEELKIVELKGFGDIDPTAQALCGVHKVRWALTRYLRGPDAPDLPAGERVICRRNARGRGVYNGMMGDALDCEIYRNRTYLRVTMDDEAAPRNFLVDPTPFHELRRGKLPPPRYSRDIDLFDFGRVLTVHSAQGSEWSAVSLIDDSGRFREDAHRWLYTGITRAAEKLTIYQR